MKSIKAQISTLHTTLYMLRVVYKYDKAFIFIKLFTSVIRTLLAYPTIILPGKIIDVLTNIIVEKDFSEAGIRQLVIIVAIFVCIPLLNSLLNYAMSIILQKRQTEIIKKTEYDFYKRILMMDYETFESPEITGIRDHARTTLLMATVTIDRIEQILYSVLTIVMLTSIIVSLDLWTVLIIVAVTLMNSHFISRYNKTHYKFKIDEIEANRYIFGYSNVITSGLNAEEMKIYNSTEFFLKKYEGARDYMDSIRLKDSQKEHFVTVKNGFVNFIQNIVLYAIILRKVIFEDLSIGNYSIYISAVSRFSDALRSVVNAWMALSNDKLYIRDMIDFLNYPLKQYESGSLPIPDTDDYVFEFKNVSFKYPGTDAYVLKNMNLTINTKEKICILGENGCGKTTLIKLLMRMYWVDEGEILLNGVNIYDYNYDEYLSIFSPVFQSYGIYPVSLKENITLSDEEANSSFYQICSLLSLDKLASKHENGYNIQVSKFIYNDGIELSGGEYQKMALARALYRDGKVFILDEPTAAIDPISEYNFYRSFESLTKDKNVIYITHRLAAVNLVDKIIVFNNDGAVAECGTHKELYAKGGIYTEMFDKQAQFYRDALKEQENITTE